MCSILIERKRLGSAGIDLGTSTFDLGIPRRARVRVRLAIEAPEKLEGQARSFFGREPKDLGQDVGGRHSGIIADDLFRRRISLLAVGNDVSVVDGDLRRASNYRGTHLMTSPCCVHENLVGPRSVHPDVSELERAVLLAYRRTSSSHRSLPALTVDVSLPPIA